MEPAQGDGAIGVHRLNAERPPSPSEHAYETTQAGVKTMTDQLPVERTRQIERVAPMDTRKLMPTDEFVKAFETAWRFPNRAAVAIHEQYSQSIFCVACTVEHPNGSVAAFRMFVEREKDLLGNFPAIITLTCMGCGASERAPSKIPANEEQPTYEQLYKEWRSARDQNDINEQRMQQMQQMQTMKAAQLANRYGMGQAGLSQSMQQAQNAMNAMLGLSPLLMGGGGSGGSANKVSPPPKTATEVRLTQEIALLHEMERAAVPEGTIAKLRQRIVDMLGYLP